MHLNAITFQLSDHGRFPAWLSPTTKPGDLSECDLENYDEDNKAGLGLFTNVKELVYHRNTEDVASPPKTQTRPFRITTPQFLPILSLFDWTTRTRTNEKSSRFYAQTASW